MRNLALVFFIASLLPACDQLLKGQQQPVLPRANGAYYTACGGAVETWANCNDKALKTCPRGYIEIRKDENSSGTMRELTFQCNK